MLIAGFVALAGYLVALATFVRLDKFDTMAVLVLTLFSSCLAIFFSIAGIQWFYRSVPTVVFWTTTIILVSIPVVLISTVALKEYSRYVKEKRYFQWCESQFLE